MSSVPCSSSIRFLYWSFSFIDVDTLLPLEVDCLLRFVQRSDQPCPLSRFKSTSVLRTKIGDSALVKIASPIIDQSKQRNPNCPCSGRTTANQEVAPKRRYFRVG